MRLKSDLTKVLNEITSNSQTKVCLGIATTGFKSEKAYFSSPKYVADYGFYIHVVIVSVKDLQQIYEIIDLIDDFMIDIENKGPLDIFLSSKKLRERSSWYPMLPNSITINQILIELSRKRVNEVLIRGNGRLSSLLAMHLDSTSTSWHWVCSKNNFKKDTVLYKSYINKYFSNNSFKGVLVNLESELADFLNHESLKPDYIIDVANPYSGDPLLEKFKRKRLDTSFAMVSYITGLLSEKTFKHGRSIVRGKGYVSGGYPGKPGDVVVDNYLNPKHQLGVISESGSFVRNYKSIKLQKV